MVNSKVLVLENPTNTNSSLKDFRQRPWYIQLFILQTWPLSAVARIHPSYLSIRLPPFTVILPHRLNTIPLFHPFGYRVLCPFSPNIKTYYVVETVNLSRLFNIWLLGSSESVCRNKHSVASPSQGLLSSQIMILSYANVPCRFT